MRKVILEEWISVDGYVSDKRGQLDFFTKLVRETYTDADRTEFLETIDCILFGRSTYEQFVSLWPQRPIDKEVLAEKMNQATKIVFSKTLPDAPWGKWPNAEIVNGDPSTKVRELKSSAGKNMVVWGSITLAQTLMMENLIDEYRLHICPTFTAGGRSLFSKEINPASLRLCDVRYYETGAVFLKYERL